MPKRLGKAEGGGTSAKACSDSSQGNATVQPAPRSTARRETGNANFLAGMLVHLSGCYLGRKCWYSFIPGLWAHDNGFDHRIKIIAVAGKIGLHGIHQRFIGELQRPIQRVTEQLAAKIVDELVLPMIADKIPQTFKANPVNTA